MSASIIDHRASMYVCFPITKVFFSLSIVLPLSAASSCYYCRGSHSCLWQSPPAPPKHSLRSSWHVGESYSSLSSVAECFCSDKSGSRLGSPGTSLLLGSSESHLAFSYEPATGTLHITLYLLLFLPDASTCDEGLGHRTRRRRQQWPPWGWPPSRWTSCPPCPSPRPSGRRDTPPRLGGWSARLPRMEASDWSWRRTKAFYWSMRRTKASNGSPESWPTCVSWHVSAGPCSLSCSPRCPQNPTW